MNHLRGKKQHITIKGAALRYKGQKVIPKFLPYDALPYEFASFSKEELRKIQNGDINVILLKPLAAANRTKTHSIALCYAGSKRINYISIHKGNPVTAKSAVKGFLKFLFVANIHEIDDVSVRNQGPTGKSVAIAKLSPESIDELAAKLAEKHE